MASVKLFGEQGFRGLRAEGEIPLELEPAVKALRFERNDQREEDLDEVTITVSRNTDGTFSVFEEALVKVVKWEVATSHDTLKVVNEGEHTWL